MLELGDATLARQRHPQLPNRGAHRFKVFSTRHVFAGMDQDRSQRFNRPPEIIHPRIPRNHPDVEMMGRVLITKVVNGVDAEGVTLSPPESPEALRQVGGLTSGQLIKATNVPTESEDDQPWYRIGDVLVGMKMIGLEDCTALDSPPPRYDFATEAPRLSLSWLCLHVRSGLMSTSGLPARFVEPGVASRSARKGCP